METFKAYCEAILTLMSQSVSEFGAIANSLMEFDVSSISAATSAVTAIGVSLTSMFFAMAVFSEMAAFRVERIEEAIRVGMKFVIAKVIIENSSGISNGIFGMFRNLGQSSISTGFSALSNMLAFSDSNGLIPEDGGFLGIGYLLLAVLLLLCNVILVGFLISILVTIAGVIFEIAIHQSLAPIALSTLCNDTARSTGISFIKSYAAVCLQTTVIGVCFTVFSKLLPIVESGFNSGADFDIFNFVPTLIPIVVCFMILSVSVKKSGELTKRMFGA